MTFVDPKTGIVRMSAADGGQMNYVRMAPGVSVVADLGGTHTLLVPQERYMTNLVYGRPVKHYELPAGGIEATDGENGIDVGEEAVIRAAQRELGEEAGYNADDYIVIGGLRSALSHAGMSTHRNITVLARGARPSAEGPLPETTEILGKGEEVDWDDVRSMTLFDKGFSTPQGFKKISSGPTIASIALARDYLAYEAEHGKTVIDLKSSE